MLTEMSLCSQVNVLSGKQIIYHMQTQGFRINLRETNLNLQETCAETYLLNMILL